jgi:hypothetical protein
MNYVRAFLQVNFSSSAEEGKNRKAVDKTSCLWAVLTYFKMEHSVTKTGVFVGLQQAETRLLDA